MYTSFNYKTKKALKEAVERRNALRASFQAEQGLTKIAKLSNRLTVFQPNGDLYGITPPTNGTVYLEGPHYPEPHRWYAQATVENGVVVKVR